MFDIRSEAKKEMVKEVLEDRSNNLLSDVEKLLDTVRKDIEDIKKLKSNIDKIKLCINERLDIVLAAICNTNNFYIKNPVGVIADDFSWYGKPYIANSYIILPVKYISGGDKVFFAFIPRTGLGTIVVEDIMEDELEMDMKSRCMSSMIFSDRPEITLAGVLMTSSSKTIAEWVKYDDNKEGEHYIYFTRDYHGYTVRLTSEDTMLGNFWLEVSKDEKTVAIGPLRPDLDYTDAFDNDIVEPDLLGRVLESEEVI